MANELPIERKAKILSALQSLVRHDGWKIVRKVLEQNIRDSQNQLEGNDPTVKIENINDLKWIQDKLSDRKNLLNLPEELMREYGDDLREFPVELDPFE